MRPQPSTPTFLIAIAKCSPQRIERAFYANDRIPSFLRYHPEMGQRTRLHLGATGLVGREMLQLLRADGDTARVVVIARKATGVQHAKLDERVFDLAEMDRHADAFAVDDIFCALGTTIKQAGSQERF